MNAPKATIKQAVPFFGVADMERSLGFYVDGLGFSMKLNWLYEGTVRWCWLERDGAALMLQDFRRGDGTAWMAPSELGLGISIFFICDDALVMYRELRTRGLEPSRPIVGNSMWVTSLRDPDGYSVEFESYTTDPEETVYEEERS